MPEAQFITQGNKQILLLDLVRLSDLQRLPATIQSAIQLAQSGEGPGTVRTLIDLTGTRIGKEIVFSLKQLSQNNGRYAKATAFVGLRGWWSVILSLVFLVRGKQNHKVLASRSEALRWLERW